MNQHMSHMTRQMWVKGASVELIHATHVIMYCDDVFVLPKLE